jgi:hypothetical protein
METQVRLAATPLSVYMFGVVAALAGLVEFFLQQRLQLRQREQAPQSEAPVETAMITLLPVPVDHLLLGVRVAAAEAV